MFEKIKSSDIKDALDLGAEVIKYLIDYYEIQGLYINKEIISSAKRDIGLLTRVLEEEADFLRIEFEELHGQADESFWMKPKIVKDNEE